MERDHSGESISSWPNVDEAVVRAIKNDYVLNPEQFTRSALSRIYEEQTALFQALVDHSFSTTDPQGSLRWSLVFYEALARSAETAGTTLPVVTDEQVTDASEGFTRVLSAIEIDGRLAHQAMRTLKERQKQQLNLFMDGFGVGAERLGVEFMTYDVETTIKGGDTSMDTIWLLLAIVNQPGNPGRI